MACGGDVRTSDGGVVVGDTSQVPAEHEIVNVYDVFEI